MSSTTTKDWFENWFDSKYYHLLYKDRNDSEAEFFISNLLKYLQPEANSRFLDLACGRGRHSVMLNKHGHKVIGVDLSKNSIEFAKQYQNDALTFEVHDMREMYYPEAFDYVFNLFTSFGYFNEDLENLNTLISVKNSLKRGGRLVIDFFNAEKVKQSLVRNETKVVDGITFNLEREIVNGKVIKHIRFEDEGNSYHFTEQVQLIDLDKFTDLFEQANLQVSDVFGSYKLDDYDENTSDRLILIVSKL
jgi:SAM-dependent methyltransferase